jgi:hypothetical protein
MDTSLVLFLAGYGILLGIGAFGSRELRAFLATTPAIGDSAALERFKTVARHNMYGALAQLALGAVAIAASIWVLSRHGLLGFLGVTAANALLFLGARRTKALELRVQALPTSSEALEQEYRRIIGSWLKRPLPDF